MFCGAEVGPFQGGFSNGGSSSALFQPTPLIFRGKLHSLVHKHQLHTYLLPQRAFVVFAVVHNNQHYTHTQIYI